jgi:hypothetical protein
MTDLGNSTGSTNIGGNENPPRQTRKIISSSLKSATKHHDNTESNGERWESPHLEPSWRARQVERQNKEQW